MRKLTSSEVRLRVEAMSSGIISLDENTFIDTRHKAKFLDKDYGEFLSRVNHVLSGSIHPKRSKQIRNSKENQKWNKIRNTLKEKYGVENVSQVPEFALKASRSMNYYYEKIHWKTNKKLDCQGLWEANTVEWLNQNKINFDWQITKKLSNGKTYRIDLYLIDEDKYVEIKGYFKDQDAKNKWEMFHKENPNSELWQAEHLKKLNIKLRK